MHMRVLQSNGDGTTTPLSELPEDGPSHGWLWVDVMANPGDGEALAALTRQLEFDALAVRDAVDDRDLSKVDDFGHHLLVVLHGLRNDRVETYELDCFLTDAHLVTVHLEPSPAVDALWAQAQTSSQLASIAVDELVGCLADVLTRRLLSVTELFDQRIDDLTLDALDADPDYLGEMMAMRIDLAKIRRVVHPQREALDVLRTSNSQLLSDAGRRRLSDVFDVAVRATQELDASRSALAETLGAYRGAEARDATNVTKVLTVYAAIMFPLSLVAGFYGMNFANLPGLQNDSGWAIVTAVMVLIAAASLAVFVVLGWIRRPSIRKTGATLGRGLAEAARAPVHIGGAIYEISTNPLRHIAERRIATAPTDEED